MSILVDDKHFDRISKFTWTVIKTKSGSFYVRRILSKTEKLHILRNGEWTCLTKQKKTSIPLANEVMQNFEVMYDHKDRNGLNNQEENLRKCSYQENMRNRTKSNLTPYKYKGVCFVESRDRWQASIGYNYKQIWLGYFKTEEEAALAYNKKAIELFGEFAALNNITNAE